MRIARKFLQLTKYTIPHGKEYLLTRFLPKKYKTDSYGNYYYIIGDSPSIMFTCHLDTVGSVKKRVKHIFENNIIKTDGKTILGADDKAGMVVLLYMIENRIPGVYYFFVGEEVGCVGSKKVSIDFANNPALIKNINKVVSFDRRSDSSIITHQFGDRCCSDEFGEELANRLNSTGFNLKMELDRTGIYTDSAQFTDIIPECTNISVGYKHEHTTQEYQNIDFLKRLCKSVCNINWETLPVKRDPSVKDNIYSATYNKNMNDSSEYSEEFYSYFSEGDSSVKMYIAKSVIKEEAELIKLYLLSNGYNDLEDMIWNGNNLYVYTKYNPTYELIGDRSTLMEFIPELSSVLSDKLKKELPIKPTIYDDWYYDYHFYM
jgi:hypothetical protein